jgi:hypothetical protein
MGYEPDNYQKRLLEQMYDSCKKWLIDRKKYKGKSVLFSIIKLSKNDRYELINNTSEKYIDAPTAMKLMREGLIREADREKEYAFTAAGMEFVERELMKNNNFINSLDAEYFNVFEKVSIADRHRIILLSMVATRTFSSDAMVDLKESAGVQDQWWDIMLQISDLLVDYGVIDESSSMRNRVSKSNIEHPASDVIRHSDVLPRATKGIFSKTGKNEYYLSIMDGDTPKIKELSDILSLVFENKHDPATLTHFSTEIRSFCRMYGLEVVNSFSKNYYESEYDNIILDAFSLLKEKYNA